MSRKITLAQATSSRTPGTARSTRMLSRISFATRRVGWYVRRVRLSLIRGVLQWPRFWRSPYPPMLGSRVRIDYASKMVFGSLVYLGENSRVNAFSISGIHLSDGVTIRENAWIQCSSSLESPGEGLWIGRHTYVGPRCTLGVGGAIRIGASCSIGANVTMIAENHVETGSGPSALEVRRSGIAIGDGCWIGHGVTILDGVSLGEACVVGAGAVVTRSFPANSRIAGVPARPLK